MKTVRGRKYAEAYHPISSGLWKSEMSLGIMIAVNYQRQARVRIGGFFKWVYNTNNCIIQDYLY
jgi:hypothetical protein